jgi:parallel beta-helix repeat protein
MKKKIKNIEYLFLFLSIAIAFSIFLFSGNDNSLTGASVGVNELAISEINYSGCDFNLTDCKQGVWTTGSTYCLNQSITASGNCVIITVDNLVFEGNGFEIIGNGSGLGISMNTPSNISFDNFTISNFTSGISLTNSNNITVNNSNCSYNSDSGVKTETNSGDVLITNSFFSNNGNNSDDLDSYDAGITINGDTGTRIINNQVHNNVRRGIRVNQNAEKIVIDNNTISNNGIFGINFNEASNCNLTNNTISSHSTAELYLSSTSGFYLSGNNITNSLFGLSLLDSNTFSVTFYDHIIDNTNTVEGKPVLYYYNVSNLVINGNETGHLTVAYADNVTITNITLSGGDPLTVAYTNNSIISNNVVNHSFFSIQLENCTNNLVNNNTFYGGSTFGQIYMIQGSENNTFLNNNFTNTNAINDLTPTNSPNTLIYNNSFGEIKWSNFNNNTISALLGHKNNLFIGDNVVALNSSAHGTLNITANLTLKGLSFSSVTQVLKVDTYNVSSTEVTNSGTDCNGTSCLILSYNSSTGTLKFNTSSFSSFTAAGSSDLSPNVTLNTPAAGYSNDSAELIDIIFNCSTEDDAQLVNLSLYLTNNENTSFVLNQTTIINGTSNSSNWTLELSTGDYTWNCLAYDNASQLAFATSNRTIVLDYTAPSSSSSSSGSSGGGSGGGSLLECTSDSDCEENQICENYNCVSVSCKNDQDCGGTEIINNYCYDNNVYQEYQINNCLNPSTVEASCTSEKKERLHQECDDGCNEGECLSGSSIIESEELVENGENNYATGKAWYESLFTIVKDLSLLWLIIVVLILLVLVVHYLHRTIKRRGAKDILIKEKNLVTMPIKKKDDNLCSNAWKRLPLDERLDKVNNTLEKLETSDTVRCPAHKLTSLPHRDVPSFIRGVKMKDKITILNESKENAKLRDELKDLENELNNVDRVLPKKVLVKRTMDDVSTNCGTSSLEKKNLKKELRDISHLLGISDSKPKVFLQKFFRKKKGPRPLTDAEKKAVADVIRISKKISGNNPLPMSELQRIEKDIVRIRNELKKEKV